MLHGQAGRHAAAQGQDGVATLPQTGTLQERLDAIEAVVLREVMLRQRWNKTRADCNTRLWNGDGSCTRGGYACISCTEPGFQDPGHAFHATPKIAGIPIGLPTDMPKAWFVALASLSKSATPKRVRQNATADHLVVAPQVKRTRLK